MLLGIDQLLKTFKSKLKNKKIGLLCHAASVDSNFTSLLSLFQKNSFKVTALFAPEHGLWGVAQDMESVDSRVIEDKNAVIPAKAGIPRVHLGDPSLRWDDSEIPIYSLYGSTPQSLKPKKEWLRNLDAVICDLQDVGSRYYTFIYSIAFMMEACAEAGIPIFVLDRPNPINGIDVEGNIIQKGFESFVGAYPIANRHGMTVGELAQYFSEQINHSVILSETKNPVESIGSFTSFRMTSKVDLTVVPLKGWKRKSYLDETKLPWVLPSPNMPTLETAIVYPGLCLLEATEISEGRGTTRPFEIFGAPFIDPDRLVKSLKEFKLSGVYFRPLYFKPIFQKCANQVCGGVQIHIIDRKKFKPYLTGLAILKVIHDLYPNEFKWREKPYEFVSHIPAIDLLTGSDQFRKNLESGKSWKEIKENYEEGKSQFLKERRKYLLYK